MRINIGSKNPAKVEAVQEVFSEYFPNLEITVNSYDVNSGVLEQPRNLRDIVLGSKNRAKKSFKNCNYSVGLESGIVEFPYSESGFQDICVCSIFDGKIYYQGTSGGFEVPRSLVCLILKKDLDLSQATRESGFTNEIKIGAKNGIIGLLTNDRITRKTQIKQAIAMAMPRLVNPQFYLNNKNGLDYS